MVFRGSSDPLLPLLEGILVHDWNQLFHRSHRFSLHPNPNYIGTKPTKASNITHGVFQLAHSSGFLDHLALLLDAHTQIVHFTVCWTVIS